MPYKSFGFTDHQLMIRDTIIGLMERELPPEKIEALEKASAYPEGAFGVLAEEGWLALPFAEELGGAAASYKDMAVFIEALAYVHPGITSAYMTTVIYGGMQLARNGNDWMRNELLPELIQGHLKMAIAMSEPSGGSDLAQIKTRAVPDGDDWVLSGQKVYITNAHVADRIVVAAKTDPDAGRHGMSLLLVDTKAAGVDIRPMDPLGRRTSLPNEIFFDEVKVAAFDRCEERRERRRRSATVVDVGREIHQQLEQERREREALQQQIRELTQQKEVRAKVMVSIAEQEMSIVKTKSAGTSEAELLQKQNQAKEHLEAEKKRRSSMVEKAFSLSGSKDLVMAIAKNSRKSTGRIQDKCASSAAAARAGGIFWPGAP